MFKHFPPIFHFSFHLLLIYDKKNMIQHLYRIRIRIKNIVRICIKIIHIALPALICTFLTKQSQIRGESKQLNFNCMQFFKFILIFRNKQREKLANQLIMNLNHFPFMFLYYPDQPYFNFGYYPNSNITIQNHINHINLQPALQEQNIQELIDNTSLESLKNSQSRVKQLKIKKISKRKQKKIQSFKTESEDIEFRHRQQTANRNLCSNTLKVYFKQLRDEKTETFLNIAKIIECHGIKMTAQNYMRRVNLMFPPTSTYISFDHVKKIFNSPITNEQELSFNKIFRISMVRFYSYEIFAVNIKSIRTTRKIRNQQIKQGKLFLRELSF